jgi:AcrR family transcriptional regulator
MPPTVRRVFARFQLVFCDHPGVPQITRRRPRQARSRATVQRIVDAGARVLEQDGYHGASTNRIAAAAGVSPGSLYQYFTDKDEIVAEIIERLIEDFAERVAPALRDAISIDDPATRVRTVLGAVLDALESQAILLGALVDRVPAADQAEALRPVRARITDFIHHTLATQREQLRHDDLDRTAWTILELAQHLPVRYVLDRPPITREAFVEDLTRIVLDLTYRPAWQLTGKS